MKKQLLKKNEEKKLSEDTEKKVTGGLESLFESAGEPEKTEKNKIPGHNEDVWKTLEDPTSLVKTNSNG